MLASNLLPVIHSSLTPLTALLRPKSALRAIHRNELSQPTELTSLSLTKFPNNNPKTLTFYSLLWSRSFPLHERQSLVPLARPKLCQSQQAESRSHRQRQWLTTTKPSGPQMAARSGALIRHLLPLLRLLAVKPLGVSSAESPCQKHCRPPHCAVSRSAIESCLADRRRPLLLSGMKLTISKGAVLSAIGRLLSGTRTGNSATRSSSPPTPEPDGMPFDAIEKPAPAHSEYQRISAHWKTGRLVRENLPPNRSAGFRNWQAEFQRSTAVYYLPYGAHMHAYSSLKLEGGGRGGEAR